MLLRLSPTHSAAAKCMSCVDYRPWPYMLLSADTRIPEIVYHIVIWDSRPVYISSLVACVFSTMASSFTIVRHETSGDRIPHRLGGIRGQCRFLLYWSVRFRRRHTVLLLCGHENSDGRIPDRQLGFTISVHCLFYNFSYPSCPFSSILFLSSPFLRSSSVSSTRSSSILVYVYIWRLICIYTVCIY